MVGEQTSEPIWRVLLHEVAASRQDLQPSAWYALRELTAARDGIQGSASPQTTSVGALIWP